MMMEEPLEGNFLGLDLAQVVGVVPNDNAGYNFGVGLVFSEAIAFEVSPVIPNGEGEQEAVAMNQLDSAQSDNRRDRKTIQDALDAEIAATDDDFASAKEARELIASDLSDYEASNDAALAAEIASTDADFASATTDRALIRTEMATNESDRDSEIATAKAAADQAIVDAKALLDAEQKAQDDRLDVLEGDENVEGSIDNHIKNVIDGSPAALDTLNELAEALGDDADFASTITDLVAQHKLDDASARATMKSELDAKDTEIENALNTYKSSNDAALAAEIAATDDDFDSAKDDRALIRTEMSENESNRDEEIAIAKDAADQAIVDAKALLDAEQSAQDEATANVASDLAEYEASNDAALDAQKTKQDSEKSAADTDRAAIRTEMNSGFDSAKSERGVIADELDAQESKQESEKSAADTDRAAIRTEMATNESDRDSEIATAKAAADQAIVDAKALLDAEQSAQDEATANVASDLAEYEASNDAALDAQKTKQDSEKSAADTDRALIRTEMSENESNRDEEIAIAKDAADQAIVDAKALLDAEQKAQDDRLDVIEGNDSVEGSIDWHIAQVIDAAPAALDTLNELAASLGDDADFAATVTNTIANHRSELDAKDTEIENALNVYKSSNDAALAAEIASTDADFTSAKVAREVIADELDIQEAKQAGDKAAADTDRELIRTEMNSGFDSAEDARDVIADELDAQESKQESEKVAADSDRALIRTEMAANETDRDNEIATAKAAADAAIVTAKELLDVEQEEQNTAIAKVASDLSEYEVSNDAALVELNENLTTQISEIENEGVQDADFTKQTVDVGGKAAGEKGQMVIAGKITDSMVVTFVGGLFQHGAEVSYDSDANATTVTVVLYSDQPAYSPMTVFGVKSFGTE